MIFSHKHSFKKRSLLYLFILFGILFCLYGCGSQELPIDKIKSNLASADSYSIVLEDMMEEGNLSKRYFHKYRVIQDTDYWITEWLEVPSNYYLTNESFMGMTLVSKTDGKVNNNASPPGYDYVGDQRYGQWRQDSGGNSFWEFYGKYAFFSQMFGGWYRPIYRNDYRTYNRYKSQSRPYYGNNRQYGSSGEIARKKKPDFFAKRMSTDGSGKKSFKKSFTKRIGRTKTGFRSRAGGVGK